MAQMKNLSNITANFRLLNSVLASFEAKGFKVTCGVYFYNLQDLTFGSRSITLEDPEDHEFKIPEFRVPYYVFYDEDAHFADTVAKQEDMWRAVAAHRTLREIKRGHILTMVNKIKDMAPELDLPDDWINPLIALSEALSKNILEDRRHLQDAPIDTTDEILPF